MDIDALKSMLEGFDLAAFVPKMDTVLGWVETLLRLFVMVGPLLILLFGLLYLLNPPKEANYVLGYRFWWSMASLDAWQFTHRLAGWIWAPMGLVLTIVMAIICNGFRRMDPMDMAFAAGKCILWELILIGLSCLAINVTVMVVFDRHGFRRNE